MKKSSENGTIYSKLLYKSARINVMGNRKAKQRKTAGEVQVLRIFTELHCD